MKPAALSIADFSRRLFAGALNDEDADISTLSPYVPYSLYQAAVIHHRLWNWSADDTHAQALDALKDILRLFKKRWAVAGNKKTPRAAALSLTPCRHILGGIEERNTRLDATSAGSGTMILLVVIRLGKHVE
jgi:hypothetical protein